MMILMNPATSIDACVLREPTAFGFGSVRGGDSATTA